jgi:hypothetical protein
MWAAGPQFYVTGKHKILERMVDWDCSLLTLFWNLFYICNEPDVCASHGCDGLTRKLLLEEELLVIS